MSAGGTKAKDFKVLELRLKNVHQQIVAFRINRRHQKTWIQHKRKSVLHETFDHFTVVEGDSHPKTLYRGKVVVKPKIFMTLPIERLYKKDGLHAFYGKMMKIV